MTNVNSKNSILERIGYAEYMLNMYKERNDMDSIDYWTRRLNQEKETYENRFGKID